MTMTIKVNYQKTFQQEQAPSPKYGSLSTVVG